MFVLIFEKSQTTLKHILEINNLAILQKESKLTKKSLDKILRRASQGLFFRFPTYIQLIQLFRLRPKKFRYLCSIFFFVFSNILGVSYVLGSFNKHSLKKWDKKRFQMRQLPKS